VGYNIVADNTSLSSVV